MFTVVVATLAVNIAANVVSPANDFANAFPRYVSFKTGGLHRRGSSASRFSPGGCSPIRPATSTRGCSATRAASGRSPACSSPTTGSCAGGELEVSRISTWRRRHLSRLELARHFRDRHRLRAGMGRSRRAVAARALRLRVVCRIRHGVRRLLAGEDGKQRVRRRSRCIRIANSPDENRLVSDARWLRHSCHVTVITDAFRKIGRQSRLFPAVALLVPNCTIARPPIRSLQSAGAAEEGCAGADQP